MLIAAVTTSEPTLRSGIFGWTYEDTALFQHGRMIGYTPATSTYHHCTVLEMLATGWRLLGPPTRSTFTNSDGATVVEYDWWLELEGE